ncbi:MAG: hypothetical protein GXO48_04160 [Chlorobi bacterium]|nr:hypothetical protein [Chlorobiota bacterium]
MNVLLLLAFITNASPNSVDSVSVGTDAFLRVQTGRNFFVYRYSSPFLMEQRFTPFMLFKTGKITIKTSLEIAHRWTNYTSRTMQPYEYSRLATVYAGENWISWKPFQQLEIRAGRQAVTYGTGRIFGIEDWNLVVAYPDMVRVRYSLLQWDFEIGGGWFFPPEFELVAPLLQRGFHIVHIQRDSFFLSGLSEYRIGRDSFWVWRHTAGGQLPVKIIKGNASVNLFLEGYFQFGITDRVVSLKGTERIPIRAFMFVLRATGQVKSLYCQVSGVILSGQPTGTLNDFEGSFYAEMGLWHKYYGLMDWYVNPSDWGYTGLMQLESIVGIKIKNWRVKVLASLFRSLYPPVPYTPSLSSEASLRVSYVTQNVVFELAGTYGRLSQCLRDLRSFPKIGPVSREGYVIWATTRLHISKAIK